MTNPIKIANIIRKEFHCERCSDRKDCVWMDGNYPACEFNCDAYMFAEGMKKMASIISNQANVFFFLHQREDITRPLIDKFNDMIGVE